MIVMNDKKQQEERQQIKKVSIFQLGHDIIGEEVEISLLPQTISERKAIPTELFFNCSNCDYSNAIDVCPLDYFQGETFEKKGMKCPDCGEKKLRSVYSNFTNCHTIQAIHPLKDIRMDQNEKIENKVKIIEESRTIKPITTYYFTDKKEEIPFSVLKTKGILTLDTKKKPMKYYLLVSEIKPEKDFFLNYKITSKDKKDFKKYFSDNKNLDSDISDTIAPTIIGRSIPKFFTALTQHSVLYIRKSDLGLLKGLFAGDSRCAKTVILLDTTLHLSPLGCEYATAETSTRTGISYTIKQLGDSWEIEWGILPLCDKMLVGLDGLHAWGTDETIQLREVLSQGFINVRRCVKADSPARVRILGAVNLNQKVATYPTRWHATWDSSILNHVDRNRWDFIFVFGENDINKEDINKRHREFKEGKIKRKIPVDVWKKHIIWAWQLTPDRIKIEKGTYERIESIANEIHKSFSESKIKPFTNEFFNKFEKMTVAFACLCHSVDKNDNLVVKPEHADVIKEKITEYMNHLELDKVKLSEDFMPLEELESLLLEVRDTNKEKILLYIGNNRGCKQIDISNSIGMDKGNLSKEINWFQEKNLITSRTNITLTESGAELYRKLLDEIDKSHKEKNKKVVTTFSTTKRSSVNKKNKRGAPSSCEKSCYNFENYLPKIIEVMQSKSRHEWKINEICDRIGIAGRSARKKINEGLKNLCADPKNKTKIQMADESGLIYRLGGDNQ